MSEVTWEQHQEWERDWWGSCVNTYGEETKQLTYAHRMGLSIVPSFDGKWPVYDMAGKSVLDLGGGPASMLLKTRGFSDALVVDPCRYPAWVTYRYIASGIRYLVEPAETFEPDLGRDAFFDECWIYNVLQHVQDPAAVIARARAATKLVRIFEWLNIPACMGHPHELHAETLDDLLGGRGMIEAMNENGCVGTAYYGVFQS